MGDLAKEADAKWSEGYIGFVTSLLASYDELSVSVTVVQSCEFGVISLQLQLSDLNCVYVCLSDGVAFCMGETVSEETLRLS